MIDIHCHLEQKDYDSNRDSIVDKCRKDLKAVITSCAHPSDFESTMKIVERYNGFVFATCGVHPEYVKELSEEQINSFLEVIEKNKDNIYAIGEIGLDYFWVKEKEWQEKQRQLFARMIRFANELKKPILVHTRDCGDSTVEILEQEGARDVVMHMFGENQLTNRVVDNGWFISVNNILLRSKKHKKVVRDCPLDRLMLETDAPWLSPHRLLENKDVMNDPTSIRSVAEKIAEVKKADFQQVWLKCAQNAIEFFKLPMEPAL